MKGLTKNVWRTTWIVVVNIAIMLFVFTAQIREYRSEAQISQELRGPHASSSWAATLLGNPWSLALIIVLGLGIFAELRRSKMGLIFNVAPFLGLLAWWTIDSLQSHGNYAGERSLGFVIMVAASVVLLVNLILYRRAFSGPL